MNDFTYHDLFLLCPKLPELNTRERTRQSCISFWASVDDLEAATNLDFDAKQNLRWLFLRGPARRVWPIITLNPNRMENIMPWLDAFRTKIFGPIQDPGYTRSMDAENANLNSLNGGTQFALREGENWLKFWIPGID